MFKNLSSFHVIYRFKVSLNSPSAGKVRRDDLLTTLPAIEGPGQSGVADEAALYEQLLTPYQGFRFKKIKKRWQLW